MKRYLLRTMGTSVGVNLRNFDRLPHSYVLQPVSESHDSDIEIDLCKDTRQKGHRLVCDFHKRKSICFFDNEKILNYVFDRVVSSSLHAFQDSLGMIFLHAASVEIGEKAYLFVAPSAGGKSTISAMAAKKGYRILGDDSCCVKNKEGKYFVRVFPSSAAFSDEDNLREVEGVFFLEKSPRNRINELPVPAAIRNAMPEATNMCYDYVRPGGRDVYRRHVFSFLSSMFESVRFGVLEFNRDGEVFSCLAVF